jgi:hypothetical protein
MQNYELEPLFIEDNAPIHIAGIVEEWLEEEDIEVMK